MSTKLYVGNVPFSTTSQDLQNLFAQYGAVASVELIADKFTGRSRGFAFVTMATPEDAQKATQALNGYSMDGRNLTVNEARPKEDRPQRSGGFGGGERRSFGGGGGRGYGGGGGGRGYGGGGGGGRGYGGGGGYGGGRGGERGERFDRGERGERGGRGDFGGEREDRY
jgi:RNA recognition motif-containing protein